jgi:cytochrome P450
LMSMLVKESDAEKRDGEAGLGLTEDEIMGNLFVFTAAGFDTTANTMGYAMTELAVNDRWQDWLIEEIDDVLKDMPEELDYAEVFPKLNRCLAIMVCLPFWP